MKINDSFSIQGIHEVRFILVLDKFDVILDKFANVFLNFLFINS